MDRLLVQFQTDETNAQLIAPRCRSRIRRCECSKQASKPLPQLAKAEVAFQIWSAHCMALCQEASCGGECCLLLSYGTGLRGAQGPVRWPGERRCSEWPGVFRKPRGPCAPRRRRWPFVTTTAPHPVVRAHCCSPSKARIVQFVRFIIDLSIFYTHIKWLAYHSLLIKSDGRSDSNVRTVCSPTIRPT